MLITLFFMKAPRDWSKLLIVESVMEDRYVGVMIADNCMALRQCSATVGAANRMMMMMMMKRGFI